MTRPRWLLIALIASVALNVAVLGVYVFERARGPFPPPPPPFERGMRPEMREHVMHMRTELEPKMDSLRERLMTARVGLMELIRNPEASQARADSLLAEIGRVETEMNRLAYENARRLMQQLPPRERERLLQRLEERGGPGSRRYPSHWGPGMRHHRRHTGRRWDDSIDS